MMGSLIFPQLRRGRQGIIGTKSSADCFDLISILLLLFSQGLSDTLALVLNRAKQLIQLSGDALRRFVIFAAGRLQIG